MRWASVIAAPLRLEDAVDEAAESVRSELGQEPTLIFVFVSSSYSDHYSSLPECLTKQFPSALTLGCSASGVIGNQSEVQSQNALVLMAAALPDVEIQPFRLGTNSKQWPEQIPTSGDDDTDAIVLADPFSCDSSQLVQYLDEIYPNGTKVGGVASGGNTPGDSILLVNNELHRTGAIGITLRGNIKIDTLVAQGCRPIGAPMFITRANGNMLHELDGEPAFIILEKLFDTLNEDDRKLAHNSLLLGVVMQDQKEVYKHGDFLIRNIVGVDRKAHSIAVASKLPEGSIAQFHLRDAKTSSSELQTLLSESQGSSPDAALLFSCVGRGKELYGSGNHDTELFHKAMGNVAMAGFFGNGEIGPIANQTFLHSYTSAFAMITSKFPTTKQS